MIKASVDFSLGWEDSDFAARFAASASYKNLYEDTSNNSYFFTHSEVECCSYTASVLLYEPPEFTTGFMKALNSLNPMEMRPYTGYMNFIKSYGTHYIKEVSMGAMYGYQHKISKRSWGRLKEKEINIGLYAGYNGESTNLYVVL